MPYSNIDKGSSYFNTKLYTGNGSTQSITGVGFSPDMVWTKKRSGIDFHAINDKVRGALKIVFPNTTDAEDTSSGCLTSFDSDGFSLGNNGGFNANGATFASWNWKANGAGVSNTAGTISSTVSANTTSGFSIVSYTGNGTAGATVGHGLGVAPKMLIVKNRTYNATNWKIYHVSMGATKSTVFGTVGAETDSYAWNNTAPTSSVFSLGTTPETNSNGDSIIAYCFAEVKGFSKFGSYTGNGSTDGTFIYTGFKPAFFLNKRTDTTSGVWFMFDNKRATYNVVDKELYANTSDAEATASRIDFLSNGFKIRDTSTSLNASGGTYIYMAFADNPFVSSKGIPACAR